ncbi:MAG: rRNA adenine N-6-methyltransferase family protein, partial [Planctomycetota bacterium]
MIPPDSDAAAQPWPTWNQLKGRLDSLGFRPSKRFGQNFLVEGDACRRTVAASGAAPGDFVLEVGVGPGLLTRPLLESGAQVLGV